MASNKVSYIYIAKEQFVSVSKKVGRAVAKNVKGFKLLNKTMIKVSATAKATSRIMSTGFAKMAIAAGGFFSAMAAFRKGANFQDALAELSAITGAIGKDLDSLKTGAFELGKEARISGTEVLDAFKLVASAKPELLKNLPALRQMTKEVLLLKNASGIELSEAARITAESLNIFGEGAKSANKFVNILAAGSKLGSSEIAETGAAAVLAGPGARSAGLSFLQLNAAIQTTAKGGIKGVKAGTALNAIFSRLRVQGKDFKKLGLQGVFAKVKKQLDSVTNATARAQLEAKIFGLEHGKVGLAILDNIESLGEFERSLKDTNVAEEQAKIRLNTMSAHLRKLGVIIEEKVVNLFLRLEPVLSKQIKNMGAFFDTIDPASIDALADSLGVVVSIMSLLGTVLKVPLALLKGIGTQVGELAAAIMSLDFSKVTNPFDAFSIGGKFLGLFGGDDKKITGKLNGAQASKTDVNVNINSAEGAVESVQSKTTGKVSGLKIGVNMATAQ